MTKLLHRIAPLAALLWIGPLWADSSGVILQYHHIATNTPPSTSTTPADFRAHLEYLRDNQFQVMPLDAMLQALRERQEIPDKAVAITFDDGYESIFTEAFPLLQSFGFPFTLFVSTQPINDGLRGFMSWDQIRAMSDAGVIIANHMVNHPYMLDRIDNESDGTWIARLRQEMLQAEAEIQAQTGQSHRLLAYPFGEFDPAIKDMLAAEGFIGLAQNSGAVGFDSDFLALPRYPLGGSYADLESARQKFDSLAFNAGIVSPASPVTASDSPSVTLRFGPGPYSLNQIGCFANSRPIPMQWLDRDAGVVELVPDQTFSGRRWRYICTAPAPGSRRYFWYSVQWINPAARE